MTHHLQSSLLAQRSIIRALNSSRRRNPLQAGFTLVELLVVVIILAVLSAIAVPAFLNQQGRARISAAQTAVVDVARACAAAQVTGEQAAVTIPGNVTAAPAACPAAGTAITFTSDPASFGTSASAVATLAATGQVSLTTCAAAAGWTAGTAPGCQPTRA
ncbi:prepilin-type N-terminal cleavage/methylation domain-containing protein [Synechococcus sp. BA-124 BA4]|uniref:type IV pilin protein n=1 Tax=unclassified Synechococcus TaxID=2626047 RepID=UPI002AD39E99|nr:MULTISPECIES: prepilin-type N-terminal cleavage/methylation domain-containing protein [unclassified Synechococcus]MEA5399216.1 prepilin-type N-terminal cleavage/methylation domain-containing protein [Synechococcus sp. BA-124 BA4]